MLILERERNNLFKWQCISSHSEDVPASAWTGTTMTFALGDRSSSPIAQEKWAKKFPLKTVLTFAHDGWDDSSRFLPFCNSSWASVLQQLSDKASGKR